MEGTERESKDEARKLQIAIRCAKSAFLLSSLKLSVNPVLEAAIDDASKDNEKMRREIEYLKLELVKERVKMKKVELCGLMELALQIILVMLITCFFMKITLDFFLIDDQIPFFNY